MSELHTATRSVSPTNSSSPRLTAAALLGNAYEPQIPRDQLQPGIVHLGFGAFARAHTAVFTEKAMLDSDDYSWGIVAVTQRSDAVVKQLSPQDCLYTVIERGENAARPHVVSSIFDVVSGKDNPADVVDWIATDSIRIVTLTVTEKGYRIDPITGSLNLSDAQVRADLAGHIPQTTVGQIIRGLQQRMRSHGSPISVVSCDNLPGNGQLIKKLILAFASELSPNEGGELIRWVQENVSFPNTMVDRMVPATTISDIDGLADETGFQDKAAVVAEPFMQWIIEDDFAAGRPQWESAGTLFSLEVELWEAAKLRLLNAGHSMLAYLGLAAGIGTIAEAVDNEQFREACRSMMFDDVLPTLELPQGMDARGYCEQVLSRFANASLGHTTAKVGSDGSQKLGPRLLSTIRQALAAGREPSWATLAVAAWAHHVVTAAPGAIDDPLGVELQALVDTANSPTQAVELLLGNEKVFGKDLTENKLFTASVQSWVPEFSSMELPQFSMRRRPADHTATGSTLGDHFMD